VFLKLSEGKRRKENLKTGFPACAENDGGGGFLSLEFIPYMIQDLNDGVLHIGE
jgi:hypothetical protein